MEAQEPARLPDGGSDHIRSPMFSGPIYSSIIPSAHRIPEEVEDGLEDVDISTITDEDAQSLIELSISRAATQLRSSRTPAMEKAAAMDQLEGGGYFDSDTETPPTGGNSTGDSGVQSPMYEVDEPPEVTAASLQLKHGELSLGKLPSPKPEDPGVPTPWHVGPKSMVVQSKEGSTQSSLAGVFTKTRSRSMSGGAEALKKFLEKGLPSMAQVGQLFGTSSGNQKQKMSEIPIKESRYSSTSRLPLFSDSSTDSNPRPQQFQAIITRPQSQHVAAPAGPQRPHIIRRSTSDHSLLYHSISRTSSLGDDTRFENHHEQVNSRVKAIRDSLQDRSSFRMPQMPSLPTLPSMTRVSSFSFSMNFMNSSNVPARLRTDTDVTPDILPAAIAKKKPESAISTTPNPVITPGLVSAAIARPQTAVAIPKSGTDSQPLNYLDRALEQLTGDVVVMGGYRGSILRSRKTDQQVWVPIKVGLNLRKVDLEVGLEPEDEERMTDTIYPSGMLQHIGPIDISRRLFKKLSECENARNGTLRVWDYGYDWRLSPHLLSKRLEGFLEKLPSNIQSGPDSSKPGGALVIAHSLGGLITRHVVNHRPELFSGVINAGVPKACVNILGPLRNGDAVLLSSRVLTAQVNFTLRTSFLLLPEDGRCFINIKNPKEHYPINFFDVEDWIKYRLSPCTDPPLPPRNPPQPGGLGSLLNKPGNLLNLSIPGRKSSITNEDEPSSGPHSPSKMTLAANAIHGVTAGAPDRTLGFDMGSNENPVNRGQSTNTSISTLVTIPRPKAIAYLQRTLSETLKFKQELHYNPTLSESNRYPPFALIYGKSIPTVYGAKVDGREGIPCSDSYENLAFASGDGVCLAKEAMLPPGYKVVRGGRIRSDRGHVTLLGDLNAVGRAIVAVMRGRGKGIGLGGELVSSEG